MQRILNMYAHLLAKNIYFKLKSFITLVIKANFIMIFEICLLKSAKNISNSLTNSLVLAFRNWKFVLNIFNGGLKNTVNYHKS